MKFQHYLERVEESKEFKKFMVENPKAYLCAGFFVIDCETDQNLHQIDYALPNKKIATFVLDGGVKFKISEQALKKKLPEIGKESKTDIDALQGIVEDEMKNKTITEKIKKMIAILHIIDEKPIWNLQCILGGLGFLSVHVDDADQTILKFEKHSLMDLVKMTPGGAGGGMIPKPQAPQGGMMMTPQPPQAQPQAQPQGSEAEGQEGVPSDAEMQEVIDKIKEKVAEVKKEQKAKEKKAKKAAKNKAVKKK